MFLEEYYIQSKTDVILAAYGSIRQAANSDTYNTNEFKEELDDICSVYNITIYVMDMNSQVRYVSVNGGEELEKRLMAYLFGILTETVKVIREDDGYVVQEVRVGDDEYLEMYGRLNSGISFIMRTPVESIREA